MQANEMRAQIAPIKRSASLCQPETSRWKVCKFCTLHPSGSLLLGANLDNLNSGLDNWAKLGGPVGASLQQTRAPKWSLGAEFAWLTGRPSAIVHDWRYARAPCAQLGTQFRLLAGLPACHYMHCPGASLTPLPIDLIPDAPVWASSIVANPLGLAIRGNIVQDSC